MPPSAAAPAWYIVRAFAVASARVCYGGRGMASGRDKRGKRDRARPSGGARKAAKRPPARRRPAPPPQRRPAPTAPRAAPRWRSATPSRRSAAPAERGRQSPRPGAPQPAAARTPPTITAASAPAAAPPRRRAPRVDPAAAEETRLLRLAAELAALARGQAGEGGVAAALDRLATVAAPAPAAGDKAQALALGWAREQARLALGDVLTRASKLGRARTDIDVDTLAWLVFAAVEALAREPADAAPDRLHAIAAFIRPPAR